MKTKLFLNVTKTGTEMYGLIPKKPKKKSYVGYAHRHWYRNIDWNKFYVCKTVGMCKTLVLPEIFDTTKMFTHKKYTKKVRITIEEVK